MIKICLRCGREYETDVPRKRYCGDCLRADGTIKCICKECGEPFFAKKASAKYCISCRQKRSAFNKKECDRRKREAILKPKKDRADFHALIAEIEEYNIKHHTSLSYGQYVAVMR